ncbi:MAG: hypothetical protein KDC05_07990 [Bacteroidales bacterium]|nr:hypothetical protein [Bacteroidales bacterium]
MNEAEMLKQVPAFEGSKNVGWKSPSNIALIKYWGKRNDQLPQNPSLSFTLKNSFTETSVEYSLKKDSESQISFSFEGSEKTDFHYRIIKFTQSLYHYLPFLQQLDLKIESLNSFPHSSGIASSASAMSALALCYTSIQFDLFGTPDSKEKFLEKASFLSRLGSGSAARSVFGNFVLWGKSEAIPGSTDEAGIPMHFISKNGDLTLSDAILITSSDKKKVGSSMGHSQMEGHPWAEMRYEQARENISKLITSIQAGNDVNIINIIEKEALNLHALMMTSAKGFSLLNDNTWKIIDEIRNFRNKKKIFVAFTLDAGPNVHLIYRQQDAAIIKDWIQKELVKYCENGYWIDDEIGSGPEKLN